MKCVTLPEVLTDEKDDPILSERLFPKSSQLINFGLKACINQIILILSEFLTV